MRIYNVWGGNPRGTKEDVTRCIAEVAEGGRSCLFYQCLRKRGKGPNGEYCGLHASMLVKGRHVYVPEQKAQTEKR